jgi:alpha-mannosidase
MPFPFDLKPVNYSVILRRLSEEAYEVVDDLTVDAWVTAEPVPFAQREDGVYTSLTIKKPWGKKLFDCAWMRFTGTVPKAADGLPIALLIDFNGEGLVVDENGEPMQGLTTVASEFDQRHGFPGKKVVRLSSEAIAGKAIALWVDAANNDLFGRVQHSGALQRAEITIVHPDLLALSYDIEVLAEAVDEMDKKSARGRRIYAKLYEASRLLRDYTDAEAAAARAILAPELAKHGGDPSLTFSAVGHAHMDLAWLWPIRETKRKCARTFSTVLTMMDRYPDFLFGASQPQQYAWVKENYPGLYQRIKEKVAEGRWEVQGAMWVEPDTNITGGESLIRQIVYGQRFFKEEFGIEPDHLWEPDVFGYTGALPQILAKSGVKYFMTQKLSWNEINKFPHQTFWWEGIDGSRVLAHMLPEENYLSPLMPRSLHFAEQNYFDSPVSDRALILFGIGDGGGGPGEEHLEHLARVKDFAGFSPVQQEFSAKFFPRLLPGSDKYAVWRGELYLEKHQGTLTSQARSKRFNRKLEYLLREVELSAVKANLADPDYVYPAEALDAIWREVLLYQFHDILPGSSISRVYDESLVRYGTITDTLNKLLAETDSHWIPVLPAENIFVSSSLSWERSEWLKIGHKWQHVTVPALAAVVVDAAVENSNHHPEMIAEGAVLENDILRLEFDDDGAIGSIFDKRIGRQVLELGKSGNHLCLYDDKEDSDAWDFRLDFEQRPPEYAKLTSTELLVDGPTVTRSCEYTVGKKSVINQDIILTAGTNRIDFKTRVQWSETNKMLRVLFPVAVRSNTVTCDIQFGTIQRPTTRNTTWDAAVSEVAAHKWVDLSEPGYGAALLNDCKYGHQVKENIISLNLLRSTTGPDPVADQAAHEFVYAFLPHIGDSTTGEVMRHGYELNIPLRQIAPTGKAGNHDESSLVTVSSPNIIVETVKPSEDAAGYVVRLYECTGARTNAEITFGSEINSASLTDLLENNPQHLPIAEKAIKLTFGPFEIHTVKVIYKGSQAL